MDTIYVPIICIACKRHSAISVSKREMKRKLTNNEQIELHCAYDDVTWDASSRQRLDIMKIVIEDDTVSRVVKPWVSEQHATARGRKPEVAFPRL